MKYNAGHQEPRSLDPTLTRKKGALAHPGSIALVVVALIFFAYMFGYLPILDVYFNKLTGGISSQREAAVTIWNYAPVVGGGIVILILLAWLWGKISEAMKRSAKRSLMAGRHDVSEQEFMHEAATHSVSVKVAHHTYKWLQHDYSNSMKVSLRDDLRRDLHWKETHVLDVMGNLASRCDRKKNIRATADNVRTVLDLLLYVESCPKHFLTDSDVRRRRGEAVPQASRMRRAVSGVTRMLKPAHKRSDVIRARTPVAATPPAAAPTAATAPISAPPAQKDGPLSFIRPRKYPTSVDAQK